MIQAHSLHLKLSGQQPAKRAAGDKKGMDDADEEDEQGGAGWQWWQQGGGLHRSYRPHHWYYATAAATTGRNQLSGYCLCSSSGSSGSSSSSMHHNLQQQGAIAAAADSRMPLLAPAFLCSLSPLTECSLHVAHNNHTSCVLPSWFRQDSRFWRIHQSCLRMVVFTKCPARTRHESSQIGGNYKNEVQPERNPNLECTS